MSDKVDAKPRRWVLIDCPYCGGTHNALKVANGFQVFACKLVPENGTGWSFSAGMLDIREVT